MTPEEATADGPARRRQSWNLRTIVEDVAGVPIGDLQDPARPPHPYLLTPAPTERRRPPKPFQVPPVARLSNDPSGAEERDPVDRVYPPLVGPTGRALHGEENEHPTGAMAGLTLAKESAGPGVRAHGPGPTRKPERVYLHYLLLHLDRLPDHALQYLHHAVEEESARRSVPSPPPVQNSA